METEATKRNMLFKKKQKLFKEFYHTTDFKEPILILMRRNQNAEFFENATKGEFTYQHSDESTRKIILNTKYLQTFPYEKKVFKGYICHEDTPVPLPADPVITAESVALVIDKTLNDLQKWKTENTKAIGETTLKILLGIAAIIGAIALYKLLVPTAPAPVEAVAETAKQVIETATPTIFK